jgi:hypothetical protein
LLRYYVIATFIVLTVAVLATAWNNRDEIRSRVTTRSASPGPAAETPHGGFEGEPGKGNEPLSGDAPWALSALPDCLIQQSISRGTRAYVRSKVPPGATELPPGTVLHYGPCTIFVRNGEAVVSRGSDRLRIPPRVTLYRAGGTLALLRETGKSGELRIYTNPETNQ